MVDLLRCYSRQCWQPNPGRLARADVVSSSGPRDDKMRCCMPKVAVPWMNNDTRNIIKQLRLPTVYSQDNALWTSYFILFLCNIALV
jgi:hypothetical protein